MEKQIEYLKWCDLSREVDGMEKALKKGRRKVIDKISRK